jgi:hypothetical protein
MITGLELLVFVAKKLLVSKGLSYNLRYMSCCFLNPNPNPNPETKAKPHKQSVNLQNPKSLQNSLPQPFLLQSKILVLSNS